MRDRRQAADEGQITDKQTRRNVLKLSGAGIAGLAGVPVLGAAKKKRYKPGKDPYDKSLELRNRLGWSNQEWHEYLSDKGVPHGTEERTYEVSETDSSNGEFSVQKWDKYETTLYMTYSRPRYVSYDVIDLEWRIRNTEADDYGERPPDNASISFRPAHYSPASSRRNWVYYGQACRDPDGVNSKTSGGAVCDWSDRYHGKTANFGIYVDPNWGRFTKWERRVYFDFVHTWSGYGLNGVSVGSGGIGLSFSSNTRRWDIEYSAPEARLYDGERRRG